MSQTPLNEVDAKDPGESITYTMDWTAALNDGATISTSTWTVPAGITKVTDGIVTPGSVKTSVQLSGGTAGQVFGVTNTIVTSDGETRERTGFVQVLER